MNTTKSTDTLALFDTTIEELGETIRPYLMGAAPTVENISAAIHAYRAANDNMRRLHARGELVALFAGTYDEFRAEAMA